MIKDFADNLAKTRDVVLGGDVDARSDWVRFFKSNLPFGNVFTPSQFWII